ncbi:MAG: hypothetical protein NWE95_00735 [Candidatus Bathyarchaeota archaeon]|nr:hypothetical protein [Candidatus Bathyarchaeota archaeon]
MVDAKTPIAIVAEKLGRKPNAILVKCKRLGLTNYKTALNAAVTLPKELPSIEETLKKLAAALEAASTPGINKNEIQRLQVIATLAKTYKELLADYINYREIETKLNAMEEKYAQLLQKAESLPPKPDPAQMAQTPTQ